MVIISAPFRPQDAAHTLAVLMHPNPVVEVHQWQLKNNDITLLRRLSCLAYMIFERGRGIELRRGYIHTHGRTADKVFSYLKTCDVWLNEDNTPIFFKPLHRWILGNKEICLLSMKGKLAYYVFDNTLNRRLRGPIEVEKVAEKELLPYLRQCEAWLNEDGDPFFLQPICRWKVFVERRGAFFLRPKFKIVSLFSLEQDKLAYLIVDPISKETWQGPIPVQDRSKQEVIAYLQQCKVLINKDNAPTFIKPALQSIDDEREIYTSRYQNKLIWHIFRKSANDAYEVFEEGKNSIITTSTAKCAPETRDYISNLSSLASEERLRCLKDFKILQGKFPQEVIDDLMNSGMQELASLPKNPPFLFNPHIFLLSHLISRLVNSTLCLELEPLVVEKSRLDNRVLVSKFQWAVTLVAYHGSEGNHANIFIEGVDFEEEKKGYFIHRSHHTGPIVEAGLFDESGLTSFKLAERTEQWKRSSHKMREMLQSIERDKKTTPVFDQKGRDSIFGNRGDSCFTWAREKMRIIDVNLGQSKFGWVITRTKNYTQHPEGYKGLTIWSKVEQKYKPFCDNAELI